MKSNIIFFLVTLVICVLCGCKSDKERHEEEILVSYVENAQIWVDQTQEMVDREITPNFEVDGVVKIEYILQDTTEKGDMFDATRMELGNATGFIIHDFGGKYLSVTAYDDFKKAKYLTLELDGIEYTKENMILQDGTYRIPYDGERSGIWLAQKPIWQGDTLWVVSIPQGKNRPYFSPVIYTGLSVYCAASKPDSIWVNLPGKIEKFAEIANVSSASSTESPFLITSMGIEILGGLPVLDNEGRFLGTCDSGKWSSKEEKVVRLNFHSYINEIYRGER